MMISLKKLLILRLRNLKIGTLNLMENGKHLKFQTQNTRENGDLNKLKIQIIKENGFTLKLITQNMHQTLLYILSKISELLELKYGKLSLEPSLTIFWSPTVPLRQKLIELNFWPVRLANKLAKSPSARPKKKKIRLQLKRQKGTMMTKRIFKTILIM